jgi:hypothetical protein
MLGDAGPWTRSVIQFAIAALTVMATDCNEQSVISSSQSAQIAEYECGADASSTAVGECRSCRSACAALSGP